VGDGQGALVEQVRRLADAEFREDALEIVEAGGVWEAVALVDSERTLAGFCVFGCLGGAMSLRYLCVAPEFRRQGLGRRLVEHVAGRCAARHVEELGLFCRREVVSFYRQLGFHEVPEEEGDSEDDLQVPMLRLVSLGGGLGSLAEGTEEEEPAQGA